MTRFPAEQKQSIIDIAEQFVLYLPLPARQRRLEEVRKQFDETYFSWKGELGDLDVLYYRIQSPVIVCELDHHSGVFLTIERPEEFHIHTVVRTPNGGDYGNALRAAHERVL